MNYHKDSAYLPYWAAEPHCRGCWAPIKLFVAPSGKIEASATHGEGLKYLGFPFRECPVEKAAREGTLPAWEEAHGAAIEYQVSDAYKVTKSEKGQND